MNITIEHHNDQFNVCLASAAGKQAFLTIKGCRIVQGRNGPFISWPARKLESGKYWQHCYASEPFAAAVLAAYDESAPKPAAPAAKAADLDDMPF